MDNYVLTRVACAAVFRLAFAAGTCIGGFLGVAYGLLEKSAVGIFGGAFLGLLFGLAAGLGALACAFVFNVLAPYIGGLPVRLEPVPAAPPAPAGERPAEEPVIELFDKEGNG